MEWRKPIATLQAGATGNQVIYANGKVDIFTNANVGVTSNTGRAPFTATMTPTGSLASAIP